MRKIVQTVYQTQIQWSRVSGVLNHRTVLRVRLCVDILYTFLWLQRAVRIMDLK